MKQATLKFIDGKWKAFFGSKMLCQSQHKERVQMLIATGQCEKAKNLGVTSCSETGSSVSMDIFGGGSSQIIVPKAPELSWSVDERFQYIADYTAMVIVKEIPALIVCGEPGLGKTTSVMNVFDQYGQVNTLDCGDVTNDNQVTEDGDGGAIDETGDYITLKGFTTAKAMYRVLHKYRSPDKTVVFDDCDSALTDKTAVLLLKSALDSSKRRYVSWNSEMPIGDSLPRSFEYEGSCIFISNKFLPEVDSAVRDRAQCVDLVLTTEEKIYWIEKNLENFMPERELSWKQECMNFIVDNMQYISRLSFRTLTSVCKTRGGFEKARLSGSWQRRALYALTHQ